MLYKMQLKHNRLQSFIQDARKNYTRKILMKTELGWCSSCQINLTSSQLTWVEFRAKLQKQVILQIQLLYHVTDSPGQEISQCREGSSNDSKAIKDSVLPWFTTTGSVVHLFLVRKAWSPTCPCLSQQRLQSFLSSVGDKLLHFAPNN